MTQLVKFPHIGQFRNLVHEVTSHTQYIGDNNMDEPIYDTSIPLPKLVLKGTVKLHGTNAAVGIDPKTGEVWFQSRSNVLGGDGQNMGFPSEEIRTADWLTATQLIPNPNNEPIVIFGEWVGKGIQQTVAISRLSKRFVIFSIQVGDKFLPGVRFLGESPAKGVYNIEFYKTYRIEVDFNHPEEAAFQLDLYTKEVDALCPVAHEMGVDGPGEGIVWRVETAGWEDPRFWMKTKGEEHKVVTEKPGISISPEMLAGVDDLVKRTVTDNRGIQGLGYLAEQGKPHDITSTGDFIKWMTADILREEADTVEANAFDEKVVKGAIGRAAKEWYFAKAVTG